MLVAEQNMEDAVMIQKVTGSGAPYLEFTPVLAGGVQRGLSWAGLLRPFNRPRIEELE
ncbi:MAG: hypothetical protein LBI74_10400 [Synergistaceae bacterium]|jgi:hypothetical protein|nr:hypothetical protein [Synergistaceae bacterium]